MAFDPQKITFFARTDARGKDVPFGIRAMDRQRHMYIIGKTGMGKSTLLENMAVQDIQNGEGMAFIDPHGSAAETLLNYIPEHRVNDVVYFAPFDTDYPISFNIMEDVGADKRHLVVSGLMSVFKKIFVDAWSARMEYILSNTILALLEFPDSTLLGVNRMLSDKVYRNMVVDNVKDPGVRAFWVDEFAKYNERYMQEAGDAIKNKIGQFTGNPVIRNIIGQPKSSFDIRKIMDEKKILIMNLSKGLIGETNANLLGSMLTTRIYLAAMSRADLPPEKMREMPNFYFYVDEFQSFANATFANILSEARKYHLNLTIAHQYIEQMEEEIRNAVFGNVGTIISFRVGPFDAEVLETIFTPQFLAADIVNLSARQIYLTLMIDGIGSQPFSATTLPPIAPPATSWKEMAVASSRVQFTKSRAEVEIDILKFHEPIVPPKKVERPIISQTIPVVKREAPAERARSTQEQSSPLRESGARDHSGNGRDHSSERMGRRATDEARPAMREQREQSNRTPSETHRPPLVKRPVSTPVAQTPKPQPEDLRAILKRIAQGANEEGGKEVKKPEATPQTPDRMDLKQALSTIQGAHKKEDVMPEEEKVMVKELEYVVTEVAPAEPVPEKVPEPLPTQNDTVPAEEVKIGVVATHTHQPREPGRGITPKELERMMRITTSDKPPK
jgi:hypothetical protein